LAFFTQFISIKNDHHIGVFAFFAENWPKIVIIALTPARKNVRPTFQGMACHLKKYLGLKIVDFRFCDFRSGCCGSDFRSVQGETASRFLEIEIMSTFNFKYLG
jgi:hypothetical protein